MSLRSPSLPGPEAWTPGRFMSRLTISNTSKRLSFTFAHVSIEALNGDFISNIAFFLCPFPPPTCSQGGLLPTHSVSDHELRRTPSPAPALPPALLQASIADASGAPRVAAQDGLMATCPSLHTCFSSLPPCTRGGGLLQPPPSPESCAHGALCARKRESGCF